MTVTYATIGAWCTKFGQPTRRGYVVGAPRRGDTWHLDEVLLKITGKHHWLWRAVDQHAAEAFLRRVLAAGGSEPPVVITDKLARYPWRFGGCCRLPSTPNASSGRSARFRHRLWLSARQ